MKAYVFEISNPNEPDNEDEVIYRWLIELKRPDVTIAPNFSYETRRSCVLSLQRMFKRFTGKKLEASDIIHRMSTNCEFIV